MLLHGALVWSNRPIGSLRADIARVSRISRRGSAFRVPLFSIGIMRESRVFCATFSRILQRAPAYIKCLLRFWLLRCARKEAVRDAPTRRSLACDGMAVRGACCVFSRATNHDRSAIVCSSIDPPGNISISRVLLFITRGARFRVAPPRCGQCRRERALSMRHRLSKNAILLLLRLKTLLSMLASSPRVF